MSLKRRIANLERRNAEPDILEVSLYESGLSAPEWSWQRALARATPDELEELERCWAEVEEAGGILDPHDPRERALWRSMEQIMRREAPTLADDYRRRRDALYVELDRLRAQWEAEGRSHSTSRSDREFWNVATAEVNRGHAIGRGVPLVEDLEEARRVVERIKAATDLDEVFELVDRGGGAIRGEGTDAKEAIRTEV